MITEALATAGPDLRWIDFSDGDGKRAAEGSDIGRRRHIYLDNAFQPVTLVPFC